MYGGGMILHGVVIKEYSELQWTWRLPYYKTGSNVIYKLHPEEQLARGETGMGLGGAGRKEPKAGEIQVGIPGWIWEGGTQTETNS